MSHIRKLYPVFVLGYALLPLIVGAQDPSAINRLIEQAGGTLRIVIGVLFVIATIVFLWGVIQFIGSADNPEQRAKSKGLMTWGIVGLAVMAAAWGIVTILIQYFGTRQQPGFVEPPRFP